MDDQRGSLGAQGTSAEGPSEAAIAMMTDNLKELGNSQLWREINEPDFADNFYKSIKANIDKDLIPFFVIGSKHKSLERIIVYTRDKRRIIDIPFMAIPIKYV